MFQNRPRRLYPKNRKSANRSKESYRAKTPEGLQRQLAALASGRGKRRKIRSKAEQAFVEYDKFSREDLQKVDILQFAEYVLRISFDQRPAQRVILKSLYGLPLDDAEKNIYRQLTGNQNIFEERIEKTEGVFAIGARGGKSTLASVIALYEATREKWRKYVQDGETAYAAIIATKQQQAEDIIGANCARMVENSKIRHMVADSLSTSLLLTNGMCIASYPCNTTAARGIPIFLLTFDEIAHFRVEGAKADESIHNALRPRQAQFPGAKCLKISTPAAKQGLFWDEFADGFLVPSRLTIQAPTRVVNPLIPQEFIDKEYARDPDNASREFGAQFAEMVDSYLPYDKLIGCFTLLGDTTPDQRHRYFCGIDQSGLSGRDRFAFAISHKENKTVCVDVCRAWDTTSGDMILNEIKTLAGQYNLTGVSIDRYASGWVQQALEKIGLEVNIRETLPVVYQNFKSLVIAGLVKLPDEKSLREGLGRTQAYYGKNNSLSISHERSIAGHADLADAVVTAVWIASSKPSGGYFSEVLT